MKFFAVLILAAGVASGAGFATGQAARLVIGQTSFTSQDPGADATRVGGVGGVAYANDTLIVVDSNRIAADPNNERVLLFNNISSQLPSPTDYIYFTTQCPLCLGTASVVLGQPDFATTNLIYPPVQTSLRTPTGTASDGTRLAVADTDNNRVLIWNSMPVSNQAPPDIVLGQKDFLSNSVVQPPNAKSLRGPQGVWFQNGKFFVADTSNNRVLIWNSVPTTNDQAADLVLGQLDFNGFVQPDISQTTLVANDANMLSPVSVTSDGQRLYVADLAQNRVLIWNSIPTTNHQSADVVVGQADMISATANNTTVLCPNVGSTVSISSATNAKPVIFTTSTNHGLTTGQTVKISGATGNWSAVNGSFAVTVESNTTFAIAVDSTNFGVLSGTLSLVSYAEMCASTLDFPRFALSDGTRLFIADGGNDRVLVYNHVPTANGMAADAVLGQLDDISNQNSNNSEARRASTDSFRTPLSLAWDGTNLYVTDPYNRRVMVFSPGENSIPITGVRNSASRAIHSVGGISFSGSINVGDKVTVTLGESVGTYTSVDYVYTVVGNDTLESVATGMVALINAGSGDPLVYATDNPGLAAIILTARAEGADGDNVTVVAAASDNAKILATAAGANLTGGKDAAQIAAGTLVEILGTNLADQTVSAVLGDSMLSADLGGVEVYVNGIRSPLLYVSPTQINAQVPWELASSTSASTYVRVQWKDGHVTVTTPVGVPIVPQNPGLFTFEGPDPRPVVALHSSDYATGTVSVDGLATPGDNLTIKIQDRPYTYTVQSGDTLASVRDGFVALINHDPLVQAFPAAIYTRVRLRARIPGPEGNGIQFSILSPDGVTAILTPFNESLCCANEAGSLVTEDNPALPGETILVYGTGLGAISPDDAQQTLVTGMPYTGPVLNDPVESVSSLAGGKTANVLSAGLKPGTLALYEVALELNSSQPSNSLTQLTISQSTFTSNIVTFPVLNPNPPAQ